MGNDGPPKVAVVIPFFQQQSGLLQTALRSVAAQTLLNGESPTPRATVHVIVVDDTSPLSPSGELAEIERPNGLEIEVLRQPNGGPGSARNAGIERAAALGCGYVALLDSDDHWAPEHLAAALAGLSEAPFYFANSMHDDVPSFSYFEAMRKRSAADAGVIAAGEVFSVLLDECVPHTSQVVYSLADFPDVRFDETMQRTGEDHLFWLTIAERRVPFAFNFAIMGSRGRGVSVYREALPWDSAGFIPRLIDAFHFRSLVASRFTLDAEQAAINSRHRRQAADEIAFALARRLMRSPAHAVSAVGAIAREGPSLWAMLVAAVPRLLRIRRRMLAA